MKKGLILLIAAVLLLGGLAALAEAPGDYCGLWVADGLAMEIVYGEEDGYCCHAVFTRDSGEADVWDYTSGWYDAEEDALLCRNVIRTRERLDPIFDTLEELDWSLTDLGDASFRLTEGGLEFADEALDAPIALKRLDASDPRAGALAYVGRWAGEAAGLEVEDHGVCCLFTVTVPVDAVTSHRWTYTCLYDEEAGRMASVSVSMLTVITQEEDGTAEVDEINDAGNAAFVMKDGNRLVWMSGTSAGDVVLERLAD